ncbi:MAG: hypothetical protein A2X42_12555 [Candidatus Margulisbacteria bacterium GWF2_38_17]|nr:MAG: hypothetical protein A2X43_08540 [Candidatus Margulisbacteria bacterium GWD2_39_127]OGI05097.1 MAG: hypothetical protein A2X42_12555 [Candidatus Margulisbacteria bacterium GWF2_38_17]OGI09201.1 MAG: hypothetical protein A2X41_01335 [Candidatus Margulisbacteria bacterium GWE2_39_32]
MIDKWFLEDIEHQLKQRNRVVILDPKAQCGFLLPLLDTGNYIIIKTDSTFTEDWQTVKEELFLRYEAETKYKDTPVVFYVTRRQEKLTFLFDYCFTHGCLDLSSPEEWLKKKLFASTGLQVQMDSPVLLIAGKMGIGKDITWWKKILQNLEELVNLDDELLPFLHDPESYLSVKDTDIRRLFEEKVFELLNQPYMNKPPRTLADEVVKKLFDGLLANNISKELLQLYYRWMDSETYCSSLVDYISNYHINLAVAHWNASPEHCFEVLDHKAIIDITKNLRDKVYISEKLASVKIRANSQKAKRFIPSWWSDVITLLEFDSKTLISCNSLSKVVEFYTNHFAKVDRAIRNLYARFLQEEKIIRPLQEYYESLNQDLLHKWFEFAGEYKSDQQGYLVNLLKKAKPRIAVIVGDGIRYEIADQIAASLQKKLKVDKHIMLADMPSETEHNMSALYLGNDEVLAIHKDREKSLVASTGKNITFINLADLNYGEQADYLVLTYKDIDSTGEKLQQGALKLFSEFEAVLQDKITQLINMGYKEVHLVTDHGFVLTGLLTESDKIDPAVTGLCKPSERYIRTVDKQNNTDWLMFERSSGEYKYVYTAKSHRPFKSKGVYGFSHGGFTPQEIIIPKFVFKKQSAVTSNLDVAIINKPELADVVGDLFGIKLQAGACTDLFAVSRKVQLVLYSGNCQYSSSSILTIESGKTLSAEFSFSGNAEVMAVLLDAETQEQLDTVTIKKSDARDFGGLL